MAELGYMGLAIVLLFGAVILLGLRSRRRFVAAASSGLVAADLWPRYGDPRFQNADLIYGVAADFSMTRAGWIVRDHQDMVLGQIVGTTLGVEMTVRDKTYRIVRRLGGSARSSMVLYEVGAGATAVEALSFQSIGLFGAVVGIIRALSWAPLS